MARLFNLVSVFVVISVCCSGFFTNAQNSAPVDNQDLQQQLNVILGQLPNILSNSNSLSSLLSGLPTTTTASMTPSAGPGQTPQTTSPPSQSTATDGSGVVPTPSVSSASGMKTGDGSSSSSSTSSSKSGSSSTSSATGITTPTVTPVPSGKTVPNSGSARAGRSGMAPRAFAIASLAILSWLYF